MDFKAISSVVGDDFEAVNRFIAHHLDTEVPLIREVGEYIVGSGGKRLRPLVGLLSARASGYDGDQHVDVAAVIEFLHTPPPCCMTMWWTNPACAGAGPR